MRQKHNNFFEIILRYSFLLLLIILGFEVFYFIFLPLTKYPAYYFLSYFYHITLVGNSLYVSQKTIEIVGACIGGGAYYFLLTLNLVTPKIEIKKRLKLIFYSFFLFYILNLIRIIILSFMYIEDYKYFDLAHLLLWYFGGTFLVIFIWFSGVKIFKVRETPFYSDVKELYKKSLIIKK